MNLNPAQNTAYGILNEIAQRLTREIVRKGAQVFSDHDYYRNWRSWSHAYVHERLSRAYGDHIHEDTDNRWLWQLLPEHANLCHNLPFVTLALMRIQQQQATDIIIVEPLTNEYTAASLGNGCQSHAGRARVNKLRDPATHMLYAGENLPGMQRNLGSPLLEITMVAFGGLDAAYWPQLSTFMCLAAQLILGEAGGNATNTTGDRCNANAESDSLLVANPYLHARLLPLVRES